MANGVTLLIRSFRFGCGRKTSSIVSLRKSIAPFPMTCTSSVSMTIEPDVARPFFSLRGTIAQTMFARPLSHRTSNRDFPFESLYWRRDRGFDGPDAYFPSEARAHIILCNVNMMVLQ